MKAFLKRLWFGPTQRSIDHPVFGKITLMETKSGAYWEAELELNGEVIAVGIETADGEEPTPEQERFYREITCNLTAAFARASPAIAPRYQEWVKKPPPSEWESAFTFAGLSIPVNGDDKNKWELQFDSIEVGHMFTCYFEDGKPVGVTVDG
jgi:hypothetical protein